MSQNIIGRAGRLGLSARGNSYLITLNPNEEYQAWSHYILGTPENLLSQFLAQNTDPRSLILRVLVAARRSAGQGLSSSEIVGFLEESFGVFQQKQTAPHWAWDEAELISKLDELNTHKLIEMDRGNYHLTKLGRFVGEAGVEVESIIRLVEALASVDPESINDPTLVVATQLTVELDQLSFPINKKSKQKEPQTWLGEIQKQRVPSTVIRTIERFAIQEHESTLRAKKAVACLLWITGMPLAQMEEILTQFGGKFDGAAGPIRSLRSRTCDLLPTVARVVEILHPTLDLNDRTARLLTRLEIGAPAPAIDIANYAGDRLSRADYLQLVKNNVANIDALENSSDEILLGCLGNNRAKLTTLREAVVHYREQQNENQPTMPILPEYEG